MNKVFFLYLWMVNRYLTLIIVAANIAAIATIIWDPWNFLLIIGLMLIPLIMIGLGAGATKSMWKLRYELLSRLSTYVGHEIQKYGAPEDKAMTGAQVFIRNYPWIYKHVDFELAPTNRVSTRGPIADLHFRIGDVSVLMGSEVSVRTPWQLVKRMMKTCR